jgi:MtrB/PioB family decaheme-associated outer membrane protein
MVADDRKKISQILICTAAVITLSVGSEIYSQDTKPQAKRTDNRRRPTKKKFFESYQITAVVGANIRDLSGDRPGKFQETRDFTRGLTFRAVHLGFNSPDTPYKLDIKGSDLGERDRRINVEFSKVGISKTRFLWDEIPHYYSFGRTFHTSTEPGVLSVDPALRALLQNASNASAAGSLVGPALPALVTQNLPNQHTVELRVRYDQLLLTQTYKPNEDWEFYVRLQNIRRNGIRPRGTGTFANETNGPNGDLVWEAMGVELPEPVKYRTTNVTFGVQYSQPKWRIGLQYDVSMFRNSITSLTWENPFRTTDALAIAPSFNVGRNRFVRAQLDLPPDNDYWAITIQGSVDLPLNTQVRGLLSWGKATQDDPFLPYTLNSAMVSANLLAGQPPLFTMAPPQPSLDAEIDTFNQVYTLASRPFKNNRFMLQYRYNDRDNKTPQITFPGQTAFGDSGVRTSIDYYNLPIDNLPSSYTRKNALASWEWKVLKNLDWELEYNFERWDRTFREAPRTTENGVAARINYRPWLGMALKLDGGYAHRFVPEYHTQPLVFDPNVNPPLGAWVVKPGTVFNPDLREEFNLLRRFDESDRIRKTAGISLEVTRFDNISFSGSYRYLRDDYDKQFYGLQYDELSTVDVEFTYFPAGPPADEATAATGGWYENSFLFANYSREFGQSGFLGLGHRTVGAARNVTACCAQFPIANTFLRASKINFDMFQLGFTTASKGERTMLNFSYGLGFAKDRTTTVNPFPILSVSLRTAGALDYPNVMSRQQELNFSITQQIHEGFSIGAIYRYEPYTLDDYYTNNLRPYDPLQPAASVATALTPRYLFLDSRFATYHANVVTIFLKYTF